MVGHAVYLKELGGQVRALRHKPRKGYDFPMKPMSGLYGFKPMSNRINAISYVVLDKKIVGSEFDIALSGSAVSVGRASVEDMFEKLEGIIKSDRRRKFIFALESEHDHLAHDYRTKSRKVLANFKKFDMLLRRFVRSIRGFDATVIVCADHGMIDIPDDKMIFVENHPFLKKCLKFTMCGQQRYLYCYVKNGMKKRFASYVKKYLHCNLFYPDEIKKYFGGHKCYKNFKSRLGDFVLVPKDDYAVYDLTSGEDKASYGLNYADHGGFSSDEMFVPLIVVDVR
jgi:predicted AlkP superfamily pyrophosphatase or phosphodiesterase